VKTGNSLSQRFDVRTFEVVEEEESNMAKIELVRLAPEGIDIEYDEKGDVLYISFDPETAADDSELTQNDVLLRYKGDKIIGLTILHFSERKRKS
jgi:uncharacterized protein YuzE